jgi:mRNA interferase MazF
VVPSAVGAVMLVPFPFSDLSAAKLRPALVLADAGRGDFILAQITSRPYGDALAVPIGDADFATGALRVASFARPGKLFTAHESLLVAEVGVLTAAARDACIGATVALIQTGAIRMAGDEPPKQGDA